LYVPLSKAPERGTTEIKLPIPRTGSLIAKDRREKQLLMQFVGEKHLCHKSGNVNV